MLTECLAWFECQSNDSVPSHFVFRIHCLSTFWNFTVYSKFGEAMTRSLNELNFNVEKGYVFNKKENINFRVLFDAINGDVEHVYMLCFWCLVTPLSIKTPTTPTLLGEIFGTKTVFGAIGLKCWFFKVKSTLNFNLFRAACQIESTLNFLRIRYFANT